MNGKINRKKQASCRIYKTAEFQAILNHERARADRTGSEFSLVVFELEKFSGNGNTKSNFISDAKERSRSIDEIGWFDERNIGVLLPCTGLKGGLIFAENLEKKYSNKKTAFPFIVYSYPSHWYNNGNGNGSKNKGKHEDSGSKKEKVSDWIVNKIENIFSKNIPLWKRTLDVLGATIGIVLFFPVFLLTAVYIKAVSPGPVLFKQQRVGFNGKLFSFLKFRTMKLNNDVSCHTNHLKELIRSDKPMEKLDNTSDTRIIPGGKIIRKACLDELPQLVNVLRGEMSLVGPRPCLPYEFEEYQRWHKQRFDVLPGITGLWQVSGKNKLSFQQMIRLDIYYFTHMSLLKDVKILLMTGPVIIGFIIEAVFKRLHRNENIKSQKTPLTS